MTIPSGTITNMAEAIKDLGLTEVPQVWIQLVDDGWRIQQLQSECGGKWVWFTPMGAMYGCVCHKSPRYSASVKTYYDGAGYPYAHFCSHCGHKLTLYNRNNHLCPGCKRKI